MGTKNVNEQTIKTFEEMLKLYRIDLEKNPGSTFYSGLIKNTEDYIEELKMEVQKQDFKNVIDRAINREENLISSLDVLVNKFKQVSDKIYKYEKEKTKEFHYTVEDLADKLYGVTDKLVTCTKRLEILNREEDIVYPCIMLVDKIEDSSSPIKQVCIGKAGDKYLCAQSSADRVDWTLDYMKKNLDKSGMTCVLTAWPYARKID